MRFPWQNDRNISSTPSPSSSTPSLMETGSPNIIDPRFPLIANMANQTRTKPLFCPLEFSLVPYSSRMKIFFNLYDPTQFATFQDLLKSPSASSNVYCLYSMGQNPLDKDPFADLSPWKDGSSIENTDMTKLNAYIAAWTTYIRSSPPPPTSLRTVVNNLISTTVGGMKSTQSVSTSSPMQEGFVGCSSSGGCPTRPLSLETSQLGKTLTGCPNCSSIKQAFNDRTVLDQKMLMFYDQNVVPKVNYNLLTMKFAY